MGENIIGSILNGDEIFHTKQEASFGSDRIVCNNKGGGTEDAKSRKKRSCDK